MNATYSSNGIAQLNKQIRQLSYADMLLVAEELRALLAEHAKQALDAHFVAQSLVTLAHKPISMSDATKAEEAILAKVFSRKRQVSITRRSAGWEINVPTLPASNVVGTELRPMFHLLLDQIITMHVLTAGK